VAPAPIVQQTAEAASSGNNSETAYCVTSVIITVNTIIADNG
jgi:hypothetical protein